MRIQLLLALLFTSQAATLPAPLATNSASTKPSAFENELRYMKKNWWLYPLFGFPGVGEALKAYDDPKSLDHADAERLLIFLLYYRAARRATIKQEEVAAKKC